MKLTKNELHNLVREVISESHTKEQEEELKTIVGELESKDLDLEQSLEMFEKGVMLYKDCKKQLEKVEKKISKLSESLKEEELIEE